MRCKNHGSHTSLYQQLILSQTLMKNLEQSSITPKNKIWNYITLSYSLLKRRFIYIINYVIYFAIGIWKSTKQIDINTIQLNM